MFGVLLVVIQQFNNQLMKAPKLTLICSVALVFACFTQVTAQQKTADSNPFSVVSKFNSSKETLQKSESFYQIDVKNYHRTRDEDKEFFVPHTRKMRLELEIKNQFLKVNNSVQKEVKVA